MSAPNKYGNKKVEAYGRLWDSKRELACYETLLLREKAGEVRAIETQVTFDLCAEDQGGGGGKFATWTADFVFEEFQTIPAVVKRGKVVEPSRKEWRRVVADAKGYANDRYPMKRRCMKKQYGVDIVEM